MKARVYCYETAILLDGIASAELIEASLDAEPTGAVPAYIDEDGVWRYVAPSRVAHVRGYQGEVVRTVYVEVKP